LDKGRRRYGPRKTDYLENSDSRIDLDLLQLLPLKRFFSEKLVNMKVVDNFVRSTRIQGFEFL
jgi:hypothetical protein